MCDSDIKVSVMMVTYNHGKYIEQAIQSVINQNTDFKYELLIGEDCSSDCTREIAERYQREYSQIIKIVRHNKNVGALKNEAELRQMCRGQYIAVLEGDDYWIYPDKLKRQAEFLDQHPEYIGVSHNVKVLGENGEKLPYRLQGFHYEKEHVYTRENALQFQMIGHLSGWMYRNIWGSVSQKEKLMIRKCDVNSDLKLSIVLGLKGDFYFREEEWSVYRRRFEGDGWSAQAAKMNMTLYHFERDVRLRKFLRECYGEKTDIEEKLFGYILQGFAEFKSQPSKETWKILLKMFRSGEVKKGAAVRYLIKESLRNNKRLKIKVGRWYV